MSNVLEKATAHFRNQIGGQMKSIDVPEWETKIWFKASNTLREEGRILQLSQDGKTVEALVEVLIVRARNEDGTKMFTMGDKATFLNEVDPKVLLRVVGEINSGNELAEAEVEKN
jgi:hypothetical protein